MSSSVSKINHSWALFLDRDGVINKRIVDGYVRSPHEFEFIEGVPEALKSLSEVFPHIFVVSNQQGVGKGLMTYSEVERVHDHMLKEILSTGGRIDKVYFCPALKQDHSILRKPNIGMGLQARKDYPAIRFKHSIMVGDSLSDMLFGKRLKMITVFISSDQKAIAKSGHLIDFAFPDLVSFSKSLFPPSNSHHFAISLFRYFTTNHP
jgi:histidinol-phosphate phosphatase family protein